MFNNDVANISSFDVEVVSCSSLVFNADVSSFDTLVPNNDVATILPFNVDVVRLFNIEHWGDQAGYAKVSHQSTLT